MSDTPISDDLVALAREQYALICDDPRQGLEVVLEAANNLIDMQADALATARARIQELRELCRRARGHLPPGYPLLEQDLDAAAKEPG